MFSEANDNEIKSPWSIQAPLSDDKLKKFNSVSHRVYKLNKVFSGIGEYFQITFDTVHFSTISLSFHSALMGNFFK